MAHDRAGHKTGDSLQAPLTPAECDLTDFAGIMIEVDRLRQSKQWLIAKRRPEVGFYAMNLWMAAWHKRPAASFEDDDDVLCDAAMCDAKKWPRVRDDVMRGWVKCADGRLYHPIVATKALEAWLDKLANRKSSDAGNCKRYKRVFDPAPHDASIAVAVAALLALDPNSKKAAKFSHVRNKPDTSPPPPGGSAPGEDQHSRSPTPGSQEKGREGTLPSEEDSTRRTPAPPTANTQVLEACYAAAGPGLADPAREGQLHISAPRIFAALAAGCDLEADILPVIRSKTAKARASPIATWKYFEAAWAQARDDRLAGFAAPDLEKAHERNRQANGASPSGAQRRQSGSIVGAAMRAQARRAASGEGGPTGADRDPDALDAEFSVIDRPAGTGA